MPLYRDVYAELRRVHRDAHWVLSGVFIEGEWHRAHVRFKPSTARLRQSGLVARVPLPPVIAPEGHVVSVVFSHAQRLAAGMATLAEREVPFDL